MLYVLSKVRLTSETLVAVRTSADLRQKMVKHWIVSTEVHKGLLSIIERRVTADVLSVRKSTVDKIQY